MAKKENKTSLDLFSESRLSVFLQSTAYTIIMIAIIGGGAYALDKYLGTFPAIFITGLVVAYPLTQIYIFRRIKKFSKDKLKNNK